jgi:hypothetical protein
MIKELLFSTKTIFTKAGHICVTLVEKTAHQMATFLQMHDQIKIGYAIENVITSFGFEENVSRSAPYKEYMLS